MRTKVILLARSEDYFESFSQNVEKLSGLPHELVAEITGFFTYLKASRDAVLVLKEWNEDTDPDIIVEDTDRVMNHLIRCLECAEAVLTAIDLTDTTEDERRIADMRLKIADHLGERSIELRDPAVARSSE